MELPPYDPSVCDEGSNAPDLCDPGTAATTGSVAGRKRSDEARGKNGNGGGSAAQDLGAFLFED
jgi:hypothetical protein